MGRSILLLYALVNIIPLPLLYRLLVQLVLRTDLEILNSAPLS